MRKIFFAAAVALAVSACSQVATVANTPVPSTAVTSAQSVLKYYADVKGIGMVALAISDVPASTKATITDLIGKADAVVAVYKVGVNDAATSSNLGALAAMILVQSADYIRAIPSSK